MTANRVEEALGAPEEERGERLLALEEGQWFDRKSARIAAKNLGPPLVAFANAEGGTIVVGLSDGEVEGLETHRAKVNSIRQAAVDFTEPPVQAAVREITCINSRGESDFLLVITVEPSDQVHQLKNGDCYQRIGDETRKLRFQQRQELEKRRSKAPSPTIPRPGRRIGRSRSARSSVRADSSYLGKKLELLAQQQPTRIVLIGGVYLDLMLYPIDTIMLEDREWGNLQSIKLQLGGSAYYLGKYLHEQFGQKSELLTIVGSADDPLSREAARLLQGESWVSNSLIVDESSSAIPVSVHLVQRSDAYTTIFTHRGALDHLSWEHVFQSSTAVSHNEPALLYVSAYFRSNLYLDLERKLRELSRRHVIALAHGRVNPKTDNPQSAVALKEAFSRGYIDIYFCTFGQLWALDKSPTVEEPIPIESRTQEFIEEMAQRLAVPPITVIRGEEWPGEGTAYLLLDGQLHIVSEDGEPTRGSIGGVGPKNAFNASFLMSLVETGLTNDTVVDAVHAGLKAWKNSG